MKNLFSSALRCNGKNFVAHRFVPGVTNPALFFCSVILIGFLFTGCNKENINTPEDEVKSLQRNATNSEGNVLNNYTGLSPQTKWELQQARAATAKYRNFDNAIKDGYVDINVIVPEMGYHYLQTSYLDLIFDPRKPEILVYNKNEDGSMQLVAVEYAVPIDLTPNVAPKGFTGEDDVWDRNTFFGLWLQHAWVWSFNPDGVFHSTNPLIHLH